MKNLITLFCGLFILVNCSREEEKSSPITVVNNPPSSVTIKIDSLNDNSAKISWTKSVDIDKDSVTYNIILNNQPIITGTKTLNFKFTNLKESTSYSGKVVAVDSHNNSTTTEFSFQTKKYYLKFKKNITPTSVTRRMIKLSDGTYLIAGCGNTGNPYLTKLVLQKQNYNGTILWTKYYNFTMGGGLYDYHIIESKDNKVLIAYYKFLLKIDLDGNLLWSKELSSYDKNDTTSGIRSLVQDESSNIYLVGGRLVINNKYKEEAALTKLDSNGNLIWEKIFSPSVRTYFRDIIYDNGSLIVLGNIEASGKTLEEVNYGTTEDTAFYVLKFNTDGEIIWQKIHSRGYNSAFPVGILKRKNGNYLFYGMLWGFYQTTALFEINNSGDVLWEKMFEVGYVRSLKETQNGSLISVGYKSVSSYNLRGFILLTDEKGNLTWSKEIYDMGAYHIYYDVIPEDDGGFRFLEDVSKNYVSTPDDEPKTIIYKTDPDGNYE